MVRTFNLRSKKQVVYTNHTPASLVRRASATRGRAVGRLVCIYMNISYWSGTLKAILNDCVSRKKQNNKKKLKSILMGRRCYKRLIFNILDD